MADMFNGYRTIWLQKINFLLRSGYGNY